MAENNVSKIRNGQILSEKVTENSINSNSEELIEKKHSNSENI